jgi:uncharacterized protein YbjQ (UPF0145 family)
VQDSDSESFDLPDWGTAGAPPPPPLDDDAADRTERPDLVLDVTPELIQTTVPLSMEAGVDSVIGLVTTEGSATVADDLDLSRAIAIARSAALDRLAGEAVVGIRLSVVTRLNDVVVMAYGTALRGRQRR